MFEVGHIATVQPPFHSAEVVVMAVQFVAPDGTVSEDDTGLRQYIVTGGPYEDCAFAEEHLA